MQTIAVVIMVGAAAALTGYLLWIRPWHLSWGATEAEVRRAMPGDDELQNPKHVTTRAVTIRVRATEVWPWLVQMGYQRGGMYSYDWIDQILGILDRPSAARIIPEYQHLEVGDVIPMGSGPSWPVKAIEPNRSLVLLIEGAGVGITWSWGLYDLGEECTRLVLRICTRMTRPLMIPFLHLVDPGSFLMTRKHLLTIKRRAEATARSVQ